MKPKFNPQITKIKLNPEQAVLACSCYDRGRLLSSTGTRRSACSRTSRTLVSYRATVSSTGIS